jgi:hypothetical protein
MKTLISFRSFSDELQKIAAQEGKVPLNKADAKVFTELMKGAPVKIKVTNEAAQFGGGYFDQINKEIGISEKNYEVLAHEVGHAHVDKHILGRLIQSRTARVASGVVPGVLAGIGAGLLMAKGKKWGLLLPAALAAPTILSEMLASHKGSKLLDEAKASPEQKGRYHDTMRRGLKSYMLAPALGTLVASIR